jgi:hypothetical protein
MGFCETKSREMQMQASLITGSILAITESNYNVSVSRAPDGRTVV